MICLVMSSLIGMKEPKRVDMETNIIPVYYDSLMVYEICKLDNTRDHETLDWFYYTSVDDQTSTMFHVSIIMTDLEFESCPISGWIKKADCCVFPQVDKYVDGYVIKYLFDNPSSDSPNTIIKTLPDNLKKAAVEEIDFTPGSMWIKIRLICEGIEYSGWTERYILD